MVRERGEPLKVLILDGTASKDLFTDEINSLTERMLTGHGNEIEIIELEKLDIRGCMGCFGCWVRTPGTCVIDDEGRTVAKEFIQSDLVVMITPITFGGYSYHLKKAIDRLIPNLMPFFTTINGEIHHSKRYESYPKVLAIGILDEPDKESEGTFRGLVSRNSINMHSPSYSVSVLYRSEGTGAIEENIGKSLGSLGAIE